MRLQCRRGSCTQEQTGLRSNPAALKFTPCKGGWNSITAGEWEAAGLDWARGAGGGKGNHSSFFMCGGGGGNNEYGLSVAENTLMGLPSDCFI